MMGAAIVLPLHRLHFKVLFAACLISAPHKKSALLQSLQNVAIGQMKSAKNKRIANAVRDYLAEKSVKRLDFEKNIGRSKSTMDHFFSGEFSERTLARVERVLGRPFGESSSVAPAEWGGYNQESTAKFAGAYLTLRNDFQNPATICAYVTRFEWGPVQDAYIFNGKVVQKPNVTGYGLVFREERRATPEYTHRGQVWIPTGGYLYLVSAYGDGRLRAAIASLPDEDGKMTGIQLSQYNPKGNAFTPAASPIFFAKRENISDDEIGNIAASHARYGEYRAMIIQATDDVVFALPGGQ
jgi:hypothetical protein